jgi:hypothetical protein
MREENHANRNTHNGKNGHNHSRTSGNLHGIVIAATWAFIALLLVSLFWPNLMERTKFFTSNFWNLVIAFTVIAQVKINRQQWQSMVDGLDRTDKMIENMQGQLTSMVHQENAMQGQLEVMREQSARMKETFVLANRASLNVHSVEMNLARKTVLVRIENTGNMPARDIRFFLRLLTFGPPGLNGKGDLTNQKTKAASVRVGYGRTELFKGKLPILLTFFLSDWTDSEFRNIEKGTDSLTLIGYVEYSDGFVPEPLRRTEFVFSYLSELGVWITESPNLADIVGWEGDDTEEI